MAAEEKWLEQQRLTINTLTQKNINSDTLLFDVDQIPVSTLYYDENDKIKVQSLPELEREIILVERIDKIKQIAEMKLAYAATCRQSNLEETEIAFVKSVPSSHRSRRSSKDSSIVKQGDGSTITALVDDAAGIIIDDVLRSSVECDPRKISVGQMMVNDFGEVGRVVGLDPNGRPILEVNDSEDSIAEGATVASTSLPVDSNINNGLEITLDDAEGATVAATSLPVDSNLNNRLEMTLDDDSILNWETTIKPALSEDSEDIRMSLFFSSNQSIRHGAAIGCLRCTDLLDKGHSTNKHSTTCPVSKHRSGRGKEGDNTDSPASKCHPCSTANVGENSDSNIDHIKYTDIGRIDDNVHDNAHHFEDLKQQDEHFDVCESFQENNDIYDEESLVEPKKPSGTKRKRQEELIDDEDLLMSQNEGNDEDWIDETQQSCNSSNVSADNYDVENAVAMMHKLSLLHSSYGNLGDTKPPPTVSDVDQTNVVAYIKVVVQIKGGNQKFRWLTKYEAIEVIFYIQHDLCL